MIRRREFIAGLGSAAVWPVVARAQQPEMPVIGFLAPSPLNFYKTVTVPFLQGLKEAGFVEGQNVAIEYHYAELQIDRLPALAADLVRRRVAVIVPIGGPAMLAAKAATTTIPIVFSLALTRSHRVLSPASTGPARTSPVPPFYPPNWLRNNSNCSAS